tara:strand:- start:756 stop:1664 length:909 start_codon:yes stop_codon:yes gene_type:complete
MKIIKNITTVNFLSISKYTVIFSVLLIISGLFSLLFKGINVSIDFKGGTVINMKIDDNDVNLSDLRLEIKNLLSQNVNIVETNLESNVKHLIITTEFLNSKNENLLTDFFTNKYNNNFTILQIESIGAKLGDELKTNARNAIIISLLLIGVYITIRFDRFYALGSLIALLHDIFIIFAIFTLFNFEISVAIIAAFLTIVGYSLNDTIVIYDRIRENIYKFPKKEKYNIINQSLNETLSRTIITSLTTLFVVVILYIWGGNVLQPFSLALIIGVVIGTYSSLFVASPIMFLLDKKFNIDIEKE